MNEVNCEFCNTVLSSKYILKTHLLSNKACLAIRKMELKTKFVCKGCNQYSLDIQKLSNHHESCKSYQRIILQEEHELKLLILQEKHDTKVKHLESFYREEKEKIRQEHDKKLLEKEKEINDLKSNLTKDIDSKDEKIRDMQVQLDKMFSTIENLAKQAIDKPTTNVTTHNNIRNDYSDKFFLDKLTPEDVKHKCRNHLTEEVFFQEQRGIARMCTEHIINTKDKKVLLKCSDVSRKKFKYIDEMGNIKEDYNARVFTEKVIGPIKQVSQEVYEHILSNIKDEKEELENKRDCESMERKTYLHYKKDMASDCLQKIIFIDTNENNDFKNELAILNK